MNLEFLKKDIDKGKFVDVLKIIRELATNIEIKPLTVIYKRKASTLAILHVIPVDKEIKYLLTIDRNVLTSAIVSKIRRIILKFAIKVGIYAGLLSSLMYIMLVLINAPQLLSISLSICFGLSIALITIHKFISKVRREIEKHVRNR